MMRKLGMTEDVPLESGMVSKAIEQAQGKVEAHNFDVRKRLVEFDDVINEHRTVIYGEREKVLADADLRANVVGLLLEEIEALIAEIAPNRNYDELELLQNELREIYLAEDLPSIEEMQELREEVKDELLDRAEDRYEQIEELVGEENMRRVERWVLLESIDYHWREHLTAIEDLRQSIGLQAYAQVDPLVAFKREGYDMFQQLQRNIRRQVARTIFRVRVTETRPAPQPQLTTSDSQDGEDQPAPRKVEPVLTGSSAPSVSQLRVNRDDGGEAPPARQPGQRKQGGSSTAAKRRKYLR
ncbi:MAG TPA: hypothetical protein VFK32_09820, partial [Tepidiformaceae bacterium]|nr:hypothetical protein [Tepidiformaceae bacterium]